ncbi:uncharacterized protein [Penaeus vannamei]|uniref:Uncharacterized protein n=1 Tax=Penaeus vannamei TaxID=6689 RepID=A0A423TQA7_PENVA|nr:uncharacterized protein LOC113802628 [Penaeus vannamei]ROT78648.1 hypothetical protein C7M84_002619 [Penaeus vannamei]
MCGFKALKASGVVVAVFAVLGSLGTEGFFAWKVYEVNNQCANNVSVCNHEDLEVRSYIGLAEGILGTAVSVCFAIGFGAPSVALIWLWEAWALGISGYNSYCIYDFHQNIIGNQTTFPWDTVVDDDYGYFFIEAICSVSLHLLIVIISVPLGFALSRMYWKGNIASYSVYNWDNDAFEMD